jgi:hypothetical protein
MLPERVFMATQTLSTKGVPAPFFEITLVKTVKIATLHHFFFDLTLINTACTSPVVQKTAILRKAASP